jgi:hypothetical protein
MNAYKWDGKFFWAAESGTEEDMNPRKIFFR